MVRYLIRRLIAGLALLLTLTLVTFAIFRTIPVNPVCLVLNCSPGAPPPTHAQVSEVRHRFGLDRPVPVQYAKFVWRVVRHGSFGRSWTGLPIDPALHAALPQTASIVGVGLVFLLLLSLPLGVLSAVKSQTIVDRAVLAFAVLGITLHPFVVGIGLRTLFGKELHLTPSSGYCPIIRPSPNHPVLLHAGPLPPPQCGGLADWAYHMVLPGLTFAAFFLPFYVRVIRSLVLEALAEPWVTTARAKGASELRVLVHHVLRLALLPLTTMTALELGGALMASIYIETVFGFFGIGQLAVSVLNGSSGGYDLPIIAAVFLVVAGTIVILNLIVDIAYAALDPRVRLGAKV